MVSEEQVANELEEYFKEMGLKTERKKHYDLDFAEWHYYLEVDLKIRKGTKEIPIEVKSDFDMDSIQKGIGQALLQLIFLKESWLAVPYRARGS